MQMPSRPKWSPGKDENVFQPKNGQSGGEVARERNDELSNVNVNNGSKAGNSSIVKEPAYFTCESPIGQPEGMPLG